MADKKKVKKYFEKKSDKKSKKSTNEEKSKKSTNEEKHKKIHNYTIEKKIGEGSFGKVYVVSCKDKQYVMKQISLSGLSKQDIEKTYQEVKLLQKFDHPNIIKFKQVFESGTNPKNLNIITEYAEKGDLSKYMISRKGKKFEEKTIIDWLTQACQALKYIHNKLIIHRDIKPHNIFLTKKGFIKLGDFGVSKTLNYTLQKANTIVGTYYYIPPEIIKEENYSFMADMWSLGVTFYQLMTFKLPFNGSSAPVVMNKILNGKDYEKIKNYSDDLTNVVYQMMSVDPNKRPKPSDILDMDFIKKRIAEYLEENKYNNLMSMTMIRQYQEVIRNDDDEDDKITFSESNDDKSKNNLRESEISLGQLSLNSKNSDKNDTSKHDDKSKKSEKKTKKSDGKNSKETKETQKKKEEKKENKNLKKLNLLKETFESNKASRDPTENKIKFKSKFLKGDIIFSSGEEKEFDFDNPDDIDKLLGIKKNNEKRQEMEEEYDMQRQMNLFHSHINGKKSDKEVEKENKLYNEIIESDESGESDESDSDSH